MPESKFFSYGHSSTTSGILASTTNLPSFCMTTSTGVFSTQAMSGLKAVALQPCCI